MVMGGNGHLYALGDSLPDRETYKAPFTFLLKKKYSIKL